MFKCECPSCYFEFEVEDGVIMGEVIPCPDCGVDLEVENIDKKKGIVVAKEAETCAEDWGE